MYGLRLTSRYKKNVKKMIRRGARIEKLDLVIEKLMRGEDLEQKYRDHELKGKYKGFRECHIEPDWLLIYMIDDNILILTLVDTGSHSDLLGI